MGYGQVFINYLLKSNGAHHLIVSFIQLNPSHVGVDPLRYVPPLIFYFILFFCSSSVLLLLQCIKTVQGARHLPTETLNKFVLSKHIKDLIAERDQA